MIGTEENGRWRYAPRRHRHRSSSSRLGTLFTHCHKSLVQRRSYRQLSRAVHSEEIGGILERIDHSH